jgi:quinol monooxygenase YgiN
MIIEVRTYRIKPGRRAEFIQLFDTKSVPAMRGHGMHVLGPLLDVENPHRFVFLRSFPSLEARRRS